jgi:hypothetical protein
MNRPGGGASASNTAKRLTGAAETADRVTARFDDRTEATGDILIGADGIRSHVRGLIDLRRPDPSYTGLISFGARVADPGLPPPRADGDELRQACLLRLPGLDETSAIWFVNLPRPSHSRCPGTADVSAEGAVLAAKFAEDRRVPRALISRTDPADLLIVDGEHAARPVWSRGPMVLVGDSACPSSSSGRGASLAIESAIVSPVPPRPPRDQARRLRNPPAALARSGVIRETTRKNSGKTVPGRPGPVRAGHDDLHQAGCREDGLMFDYCIDWDAPRRPAHSAPDPGTLEGPSSAGKALRRIRARLAVPAALTPGKPAGLGRSPAPGR